MLARITPSQCTCDYHIMVEQKSSEFEFNGSCKISVPVRFFFPCQAKKKWKLTITIGRTFTWIKLWYATRTKQMNYKIDKIVVSLLWGHFSLCYGQQRVHCTTCFGPFIYCAYLKTEAWSVSKKKGSPRSLHEAKNCPTKRALLPTISLINQK